MLSVDQALALVLSHAQALAARPTPLAASLELVLAEDIASDIDSPPHDKSIVDGYAVIAESISAAGVELVILEEVTAGAVPTRNVCKGTATRIMTGAPIPEGADAVVMVEKSLVSPSNGTRVRIDEFPLRAGQNIMRLATSLARGQVVLKAGKQLRAIEIGLLAEVGHSIVSTIPRPQVAIVATGNELVSVSARPSAGQIRNSNGPMLAALVAQSGGEAIETDIARDDAESLRTQIIRGLQSDILVLSGGVSAGVLDLVPQILAECGVEQVFHKVNLKPGKPLWFGTRKDGDKQTLVFGLPGNPVSSLVCFELFVRPTLAKIAGRSNIVRQLRDAELSADHRQRGDRPTYWPATLAESSDGNRAKPLAWKGSSDLCTLTDSDCLIYFPPGEREFKIGDRVTIYPL